MPPSAMIGTPASFAGTAASMMAVICGAPTPATTRVVQMEPGPIPTFTASAPASIMAFAAARVARLPPITSTRSPNSFFTLDTISSTPLLWACAVSTMSTSTPASVSAPARDHESAPVPMPAPTSSLPDASFEESGYCSVFTKSLTVIRPTSLPASSTMGSFSTLLELSRFRASFLDTPLLATTRGMAVITSATVRDMSGSKRMSRLVQMPTRVPSLSTTGRPEIRYRAQRASTSPIVMSGLQVIGSVTIPDSERFTSSTCWAWSSMERLRCNTPIPPCRAIAIAMRASVTVSIAAEISGIFKRILRVNCDDVSTSLGIISDASGSRRTSSKVKPTRATLFGSSPPVGTCISVIKPFPPTQQHYVFKEMLFNAKIFPL